MKTLQETPEIGVWVATPEMKSQFRSGRAAERKLNREWSASSEERTQIPIFHHQLYLILMTFFLFINTSPNFLMTFLIKLCNTLTCILFSKISTNHWTSLQQTWKNGWVSSFISQYQNSQSWQCTRQKNLPLTDYASERYVNHSNVAGHHQDDLTLMQREDVAILQMKFILIKLPYIHLVAA